MDTGYLKHSQVESVRNPAQKVHTAQIQIGAKFLEHSLSECLSIRKAAAVTDTVTTDNEYMCIRTLPQHFRQAAHETWKAAIRFQIARNIGHHFISRAQFNITTRKHQSRSGIRNNNSCINALVNDFQYRMVTLRIHRFLPCRRTDTEIHTIETKQIADILGADAWPRIRARGIAGIKAGIGAACTIEEFEVTDERCILENIFQVSDFAPAVVPDDHVRDKSRFFQAKRHTRNCLRIQHMCFCIAQIAVRLRSGLARWSVYHFLHAWNTCFLALRDEDNTILGFSRKRLRQMPELPREILMDEQDFHETPR